MAEENLFDPKNTGGLVEPNLFTEATPAVTSPTTLISSDDGEREIQDNEKFLNEISPETAPGAEPPEPPSPEDNQFFNQEEGKKDEAPKDITPPPTKRGDTFTQQEVLESDQPSDFEQLPDGSFVLTEEAKAEAGIQTQEINLGGFGSTSANGQVFTPVSPEQQAIQGITDEEMAEAIAEARKRGLTINQPLAARTDDNGNILDEDLAVIDEQLEGLVNEFTNFDIDQDPDFQAQARTIRAQFAEMRNKMNKINASRQRALQSRGFRRGTTQFAGDIQAGIEGEELTQAASRITSINTAESAAISAARRAFKNDEITEFNNQINAIQLLRQNKADEINNYNEALLAVNEKLAEEQEKIDTQIRDSNIRFGVLGLIQEGITDPIDILTQLTIAGINVTPGEIKKFTSLIENQDVLANASPSQKAFVFAQQNFPDVLKDMGITNEFEYAAAVTNAKEIAKAEAPELRTVGGNLYQLTLNSDTGKFEAELVQGKTGRLSRPPSDTTVEITEKFTQQEILDPQIQQWTNWVEAGVDDEGNQFRINNVPKGTQKEKFREKVMQAKLQRQGVRTQFPESDIAQELPDTLTIRQDIVAITGSDGFVDTAKYRQLKVHIAQNAPHLTDFFNKTFPAKKVLNPNDPTAQDLLGKKTMGEGQSDFEKRVLEFKNAGFSVDFIVDKFKESGFGDKESKENIRRIFNQ